MQWCELCMHQQDDRWHICCAHRQQDNTADVSCCCCWKSPAVCNAAAYALCAIFQAACAALSNMIQHPSCYLATPSCGALREAASSLRGRCSTNPTLLAQLQHSPTCIREQSHTPRNASKECKTTHCLTIYQGQNRKRRIDYKEPVLRCVGCSKPS
jgi:hypothetical protein